MGLFPMLKMMTKCVLYFFQKERTKKKKEPKYGYWIQLNTIKNIQQNITHTKNRIKEDEDSFLSISY